MHSKMLCTVAMNTSTFCRNSPVLLAVFFVTGFSGFARAQTLDHFLDHLAGLSGATEQELAIDSFWAQLPAVPWINGDTAHFLYRGTPSSLALAGDFNFWDPGSSSFGRASGTTLWYKSLVFESDARLDYKLVRNGSEWILDPANPATVSGGFGPNSELAMPDYVQPWEIETRPGVPAGTVTTGSFASVETGKTYSLQFYLPPGYDEDLPEGYPVAYFQDGQEYVSLASAARIFDNLIDSGLIEPVIGVFVRPTNRNEEYAGSVRNAYADFFGLELVPYIDETYNTVPSPLRRGVIGASFGGNISAIITLEYPELFANCGLHSGAFWPNGYDTYNDWIASTPSEDLRVAATWGSYEGSLTGNMADFVGVMEGDGTQHVWEERPEGHSWGLWRSTLDDMLIFFFPPEGRPVGLMSIQQAPQLQLFPNPASGQVLISGAGNNTTGVIMLFDTWGRTVRSMTTSGTDAVVSLDLTGLAPGLYQVVQQDGERSSAGNLVVIP